MLARHIIVRAALVALSFTFSTVCAQSSTKSPAPSSVVAQKAKADSTAVHQFVQGFYDWYIASHESLANSPPAQFLDVDLGTALREDSIARRDTAQARELLDIDPFLDSFEPCPRYEVTEVRPQGQAYRVTVRPICPDVNWQRNQSRRPSLDVVSANGRWRIANVWYRWSDSTTHDLKSILCGYAMADVRPARRPAHC